MNPFKDPAPSPHQYRIPSSGDHLPTLPPRARIQDQAQFTFSPATEDPAPEAPQKSSSAPQYKRNPVIKFLVAVLKVPWLVLNAFIGPKGKTSLLPLITIDY